MNTTLSQIFDDLLTTHPYAKTRTESNVNAFRPKVNITETKDAYLMEFSVPGIQKDAINIMVEDQTLTISYDHIEASSNTEEKVIRKEFKSNSFKRNFTLGDTINVDNIKADFENGILKLTLPKNEIVQPLKKTITIN